VRIGRLHQAAASGCPVMAPPDGAAVIEEERSDTGSVLGPSAPAQRLEGFAQLRIACEPVGGDREDGRSGDPDALMLARDRREVYWKGSPSARPSPFPASLRSSRLYATAATILGPRRKIGNSGPPQASVRPLKLGAGWTHGRSSLSSRRARMAGQERAARRAVFLPRSAGDRPPAGIRDDPDSLHGIQT